MEIKPVKKPVGLKKESASLNPISFKGSGSQTDRVCALLPETKSNLYFLAACAAETHRCLRPLGRSRLPPGHKFGGLQKVKNFLRQPQLFKISMASSR